MRRSASPPSRAARLLPFATCLCAAAIPGCASPLPHWARGLGQVEGEVRVVGRGSLEDVGPVVVYLEGGTEREAPARSTSTLTISDRGGEGPAHALVVLTRGQSLRFVSQSGVAHSLFAIRGPERLDVKVAEGGESRIVTIEHDGWTRFYCSLHPDETWDVFVSPSPLYARPDGHGTYQIDHVPRGDYTLSIWSPAGSGPVRQVHVGLWSSAFEPIGLDPSKLHP